MKYLFLFIGLTIQFAAFAQNSNTGKSSNDIAPLTFEYQHVVKGETQDAEQLYARAAKTVNELYLANKTGEVAHTDGKREMVVRASFTSVNSSTISYLLRIKISKSGWVYIINNVHFRSAKSDGFLSSNESPAGISDGEWKNKIQPDADATIKAAIAALESGMSQQVNEPVQLIGDTATINIAAPKIAKGDSIGYRLAELEAAMQTHTENIKALQFNTKKGGRLIRKGIIHIGIGIAVGVVGGLGGSLLLAYAPKPAAGYVISAASGLVSVAFEISGLVKIAHGGKALQGY